MGCVKCQKTEFVNKENSCQGERGFLFFFPISITTQHNTTQHVQSHQIAQNVILSLECALIVKVISFQVDSVASQTLLVIQH